MYNSLMKLLKLNGESADRPSCTQTACSSLASTRERAARMKAAAEAYGKK